MKVIYLTYFIVFLKEHYRFCSVLYEHISIDVYTVIAGIAIFISLWSLVFSFSMALATILIHDTIVMIGLLMQWSVLPSTFGLWVSQSVFNRKLLISWLGAWECSSIILSYEFRMEQRHSIAQDATRTVFFLNLCFHAVVADSASILMCMQKMLYMAYMLVNYALFLYF